MKQENRISEDAVLDSEWRGYAGLTVEEYGAKHYVDGKESGRKDGIAVACVAIREEAASLFIRKKDCEATALRALAEKIERDCK